MTTPLLRVARLLLLSGIVIAATEPMSAAGTHVLVTYSGTNSAGVGFSGYFEYDQSQVAASNYSFNFDGSASTHMICFSTGTLPYSGSGVTSEPFTITTTSAGGFTLKAKCVQRNTSVVITFNLNVGCTARALPLCMSGSTPVFPSTGTFTLSGATTFSGNIKATTCQSSSNLLACPCPPPPIVHPGGGGVPVLGTGQNPCPCTTEPAPVYAYCAPEPCPVYACQPRPARCLTTLFCRGPFRLGCR